MTSVSGVGVVDKGVQILAALADGPLDLVGLQVATGIPRATAHRLALALEAHRLVRRDARGRFCLGYELIRLGRLAGEQLPIADLARPALVGLNERTGEGVQLYVRDGDHRRCVVSLESRHGLRWIVPQGAMLPLDRGSAGWVLTTGVDLVESVEEREAGAASVSAAVRDGSGVVIAAVCLSGPVERLSREPKLRFGEVVLAAAAEISASLAGRTSARVATQRRDLSSSGDTSGFAGDTSGFVAANT